MKSRGIYMYMYLVLFFFKGTSMEETGKVLNVLRQIHTVDNSEEDICEQEQVS